MLFLLLPEALQNYLEMVLDIMSHYRYTPKLKKTRFGSSQDCFGIYGINKGNILVESTQAESEAMVVPKTFSDLRMFIGMFGFYRPWIPFYKVQIIPFHQLLQPLTLYGTHRKVSGTIIEYK